jgi:uncharacterized LabA/DUF88 family protein
LDCESKDYALCVKEEGRPRASLFICEAVVKFRTACVFVDGENLRHSLGDLFHPHFDKADYLPKQAKWEEFFDHLVEHVDAEFRLRTYWYVVDEIDFWPYSILRMLKNPHTNELERVLRTDKYWSSKLDVEKDTTKKQGIIKYGGQELLNRERSMRSRFDGWQHLQDMIAHKCDSVEFRRAGSIRYDLFKRRFGQEKGVDVMLSTDLLKLNDIYDVGIIVSGDGDYVPAVRAVKDWGKHIVNVSFLKQTGGVLPGGARRLNQITDRVMEITFTNMQQFMGFVPIKSVPSAAVAAFPPK